MPLEKHTTVGTWRGTGGDDADLGTELEWSEVRRHFGAALSLLFVQQVVDDAMYRPITSHTHDATTPDQTQCKHQTVPVTSYHNKQVTDQSNSSMSR